MACFMFSFFQNCLNFPDMKFVPESDTILFGSLNSANAILAALIRLFPKDHLPS